MSPVGSRPMSAAPLRPRGAGRGQETLEVNHIQVIIQNQFAAAYVSSVYTQPTLLGVTDLTISVAHSCVAYIIFHALSMLQRH